MELEFHQLELRYERLKVARPEPERRLLASLAEVGQQVPIVVVKEAGEGPFVVIDGYKRIRALRRLGRDTVGASCWPGKEAEALITTRLMQTAEPETALEQSWLLAELHERFGFSLEELARRFGHSVSWVSRRLALVHELPEVIQEQVRRGEMGAHGAAKYLVPLARANRRACLQLVAALGSSRLSSRDLGILYTAYQAGNWVTRQRLLEAPLVFLKSYKEAQTVPSIEPGPSDSLLTDLEILSATARRADRRLRAGVLRNLPEKDRHDLARFIRRHRGHPVASTRMVEPITRQFVAAIEKFVRDHGIPLVAFEKGQRKEDVAAAHRADFSAAEGVVFVGKAQEKCTVYRTEKRRNPHTGKTYAWIVKSTALVNHYYFYCVDRDFGPFFLKFCSYFPYNAKLCLNGHEYVKRQLRTARHRLSSPRQWRSLLRRSQAPASPLRRAVGGQDRNAVTEVAPPPASSLFRPRPPSRISLRPFHPADRTLPHPGSRPTPHRPHLL